MKAQDFNQLIKDRIFHVVENKVIYIKVNNKKYQAKLYGRLLDYPVIAAINEHGIEIEAQINWYQAQRLSEGIIDTILYN